jgi:beta-lactamase class A
VKQFLTPPTLVAILVVASIGANIYLVTLMRSGQSQSPQTNEASRYPLLSKRIFMDNQNDMLIHFVPLRDALNEHIKNQKEEIGVYFEYLPTGTSIGVNDRMEVRFASLIKIPVVMAAYKQMEEGAVAKHNSIVIEEEFIHKGFGSLWKKGAGATVTLEDAIALSLIESDNTALRSIVSILPQGAIEDVFSNLDITIDTGQGFPIISPKNYSSILRSLYLSSYLTRDHSNEILTYLTQTPFNDMIEAGVDPSITVAHKIGVFDPLGIYSDCGIVYIPSRPYTLCVMVKADQRTATKHMQTISKMIYGFVSRAD